MNNSRLVAFKIERRSIAAAVFVDDVLEYTQIRQLSSLERVAEQSAVGFASWLVHYFRASRVAVEKVSSRSDSRRGLLTNAIINRIRADALSLWEISKGELLAA